MNGALIFVILYLGLTVAVSLITSKRETNSGTFHGANLGILMCVAAGAGEWMGGTSTTGVSEYGYIAGISGAWYTIANGIGIMFCAIFFAKLYRSLNTPTVSGIVGHYIGRKARAVSAVLLILVMLVVGVSQMVAIGSLGKVLFGIDITLSIFIFGMIVMLYTLMGGMVSVGSTNTMHLLVMYTGVIAAVIVSLRQLGGVSVMRQELPQTYFSFGAIGGSKISSWIIASVLGACTAQAGIQPILAAKDEKVAVKSSVLIALVVAPFGILTALLGMAARIWFPDLESAKLALPTMMQNLPFPIEALVTAAMTAAILFDCSPDPAFLRYLIYQRYLSSDPPGSGTGKRAQSLPESNCLCRHHLHRFRRSAFPLCSCAGHCVFCVFPAGEPVCGPPVRNLFQKEKAGRKSHDRSNDRYGRDRILLGLL